MNKLLSGVVASGAAALGTAVGIWQLSDNFGDSYKPFAQCVTQNHKNQPFLCKHGSLNPCSAQNIKTNHAISESRKFIKRMMLEQGIPGVQVAVSKNGRLLWTEGLGLADVENGVACSAESVMRIASISKPLTAVGLFQLWEEGLIDLDAPVQTYVPSFPEKSCDGERVTITTRQLLCHMSGIRHYFKKGKTEIVVKVLLRSKMSACTCIPYTAYMYNCGEGVYRTVGKLEDSIICRTRQMFNLTIMLHGSIDIVQYILRLRLRLIE